jgi:2-oxoglutarate dehydrogenase E1 component
MSPKSLLRHPGATSRLEDLTGGAFQEIIDDPGFGATTGGDAKKPTRLILCSGKVYYDLIDYRGKQKLADVALVRIEQLYPLHRKRLTEIAKKYPAEVKLVWAQEESENMGAWTWIAPQLQEIFGRGAAYAGRDASASPAVGTLAMHKLELAALLKQAFTI